MSELRVNRLAEQIKKEITYVLATKVKNHDLGFVTVTEGKVSRDGKVRVIRDSVVIYEGETDTLRRFKDDVKEVQSGYECGMTVENFNDIKEGDVFEVYIMEEVKK